MRRVGLLAVVALLLGGWPGHAAERPPRTSLLTRRHVLGGLVAAPFLARARLANPLRLETRVAFGSCNLSDQAQPIWRAIAAADPELFAFLGDTVYADTEDMDVMRSKYNQLATHPDFAPFRQRVRVVGTWDDHDYGGNDVGRDYPKKWESKKQFLDFLGEPAASERRQREGVYTSYLLGPSSRRVQLVLLDMRWFRSGLREDKDPTTYLPDASPSSTFLGNRQWQWLEDELRVPADVRLIGSSIQFAASENRFEKWANFPREKQRLMQMIDDLRLKNTLILSGDVHFGELSRELTPGGFELLDFTSSGLNRSETAQWRPNAKRLALYDRGHNFGLVTVDWRAEQMRLELRTGTGVTAFQHVVPLR